ncbi:MAG: ATP-dependent metallopeptidase FtsH/Yme1/Tma family protein, partial [Rhodobacteraceae bacterium]|nr:ATP-dependent metallopeptidase FtsH/Yme1/Tma family protein [Paracoccaceae bacterium]
MGNARNIAFWVVLFLLILALFNLFSGGQSTMSSRSISYSDFVQAVENHEVSSVTLDGEKVLFRGNDGQDYVTIVPQGTEVTERLIENKVSVSARPQEQSGFTTLLMTFLPFLLLIGVWIYFMNRMQGGGRGGAMGFGKSRAKLLTEREGRVTFDDVA